ncbi:MAG TPA: aldehyde dehydrogenase family protein, partial [Acidothermaceae bacterium]|nr:aldehyde dehydrogenase family protein [Acidothermaceae bacterium]
MAVEIPGVADIVPTQLYIGGKWSPSADGSTVQVVDPSSGAVIADVANATVDDGLAAVAAAAEAAAEWASTAPRQRAEILRRMFELMTQRRHDLARLISIENGKALPDAAGEVAYAAEFFRWYAEEAVRLVGQLQTAPSGANRILVVHQPV